MAPRLSDAALEQIRAAMAAAGEDPDADDPKALRRRIAKLEKDLAARARSAPAAAAAPPVEIEVPVSVVTPQQIEELRIAVDAIGEHARRAERNLRDASAALERVKRGKMPFAPPTGQKRPASAPAPRAAPAAAPRPRAAAPANGVSQGAIELLRAIASLSPDPMTMAQAATLAGQKPRSSTVRGYLAALRKSGYVDGPGSDTRAKAFITRHHYSAKYVAAVRRFELYRGAELVGLAVFSQQRQAVVDTLELGLAADELLELSRFVLLDDVPANGETWFLGQAFAGLRADGLPAVLFYSDPVPRTSIDGTVTKVGHFGTIYQAHNGVYLGRATPRSLRLLPSGAVFSEQERCKVRQRLRGWEYAVRDLVAAGAPEPGSDLRAWLKEWLPRVTRPLRHRGNHKYVWALDRRLRRHLPDRLPYPKARSR